MDYDNTDTGALFKNDKEGNENRPDYTGNIYDANGKKRRVAAWLKKSNNTGQTFLSLKVSDYEEQNKPQAAFEGGKVPVQDDDLPF